MYWLHVKLAFHEAIYFLSFYSGQTRFRTRKIILLCVPHGLHDFKTREMLHCFLFHLGNTL